MLPNVRHERRPQAGDSQLEDVRSMERLGDTAGSSLCEVARRFRIRVAADQNAGDGARQPADQATRATGIGGLATRPT